MRVNNMKNTVRGGRIFSEENSVHGRRFGRLRNSGGPGDEDYPSTQDGNNDSSVSPLISPQENNSPFQFSSSPLNKSPWSSHHAIPSQPEQSSASTSNNYATNALIGSLVREEGHIYSLAAFGDLLYTGSDSKNIRVWKNQKEFSGFKSNSGLVKAIVISNDEKIFTGHQDGKIRVWKISAKNPSVHKRIGTLPTLKAYIKSSIKPSNYVEVRRKRNAIWIKHFDAISCLSLNEDQTYLYSGSWDKSFKVWRISDSKCLESINAHDDAVNSIVAGFDGLVFTGSADGTVKVWRRELQGKGTKHFFSQTLLKQEFAVTALAVNRNGTFVYCGSSDGLVNFWEKEKNLSHGGALRGHKLAVLCLAANGNLVFSGSADMGICAWQRLGSDHACLFVLTGHTGPVKCLAVEKDSGFKDGGGGDRRQQGWILYSGSLDKSVKMWRVLEREVSELQQVIGMRKQEQNYNNNSNCNSDGYATTPSPLNQTFSFHSRTSQNSLNRRY